MGTKKSEAKSHVVWILKMNHPALLGVIYRTKIAALADREQGERVIKATICPVEQ